VRRVRLSFKKGTAMSIKSKVLAAAATLTVAGGCLQPGNQGLQALSL
jgi:hypothetical protein